MESARADNRERLPSDLQQVLIIARYDLYKHLRSKRLLGLLLIAGLILGLMYFLPILLDQETSDDPVQYITSYIGSVSLLLVLGATMFAGDAIVSEYQSRTGYLLFPQPVKRSVIYLGKYLSTVGIVSLMLLVFYCAAALLTVASTGGSSHEWIFSMLFAMCYGAAASALGMFLSSFMKGGTGALVLTFFALVMILPMVEGVLIISGIEPYYVLTYAEDPIYYLLFEEYPEGGLVADVWPSLAVVGIYSLALTVLGILRFQRREMVS